MENTSNTTAPTPTSPTTPESEQKVRFRLRPPKARYSPWRWYTPFITELIAGTSVIYLPAFVGKIIAEHSEGNLELAHQYTWYLLGIIIILSLNEFIGWGTTIGTINRLERDWKLYVGSLLGIATTQRDPGPIIALINKDARSISSVYMSLVRAFSSLPIMILGTLQLWLMSPAVALVSLGGILLTVYLLTVVSKALEKRAEIFRDTIGINTSKASDIASSIRTILGLGAGTDMLARYRDSADKVRQAQLNYQRVQSWSSSLRVVLVGFTTMAAIGLALRGNLNNGTWVTDIPATQLVTVSGIITMMLGPIWSVEMFLYGWRTARVALKRMNRFTAETENPAHQKTAEKHRRTPTQLPNISTPTQHGITYINPQPLHLTAQEAAEALATQLRSTLGANNVLLSEPNPTIFAGTLQQHLQLGTTGLSQKTMLELLRLTDSEEIAQRMTGTDPKQYLQAQLSSEGTNLSGGQRQRLALARALAQQVQILVLCEPLNSVDGPSQSFILNELEAHIGEPGVLEHLHHIFIISTTVEAEQRIARDQQDAHTTSPNNPTQAGKSA